MILFDHHVHSSRSDGTVSLEDRSRSAAVRRHGVSDHFPFIGSLETDDDVLRYLEDGQRLGLRVGIEYDLGVAPALRPTTRAALHYVIGSIHQVFRGDERVGYDAAGEYLKGRGMGVFTEREKFGDPVLQRLVLERTLELVEDGIGRHGIDIVGHPTFTPLAALGDPEESYPVVWQERFIELCVRSDVAIEVNERYGVPHAAFLRRAKRAGARFALGSDAHGDIGTLGETELLIAEADLDRERFLNGRRSHPAR